MRSAPLPGRDSRQRARRQPSRRAIRPGIPPLGALWATKDLHQEQDSDRSHPCGSDAAELRLTWSAHADRFAGWWWREPERPSTAPGDVRLRRLERRTERARRRVRVLHERAAARWHADAGGCRGGGHAARQPDPERPGGCWRLWSEHGLPGWQEYAGRE